MVPNHKNHFFPVSHKLPDVLYLIFHTDPGDLSLLKIQIYCFFACLPFPLGFALPGMLTVVLQTGRTGWQTATNSRDGTCPGLVPSLSPPLCTAHIPHGYQCPPPGPSWDVMVLCTSTSCIGMTSKGKPICHLWSNYLSQALVMKSRDHLTLGHSLKCPSVFFAQTSWENADICEKTSSGRKGSWAGGVSSRRSRESWITPGRQVLLTTRTREEEDQIEGAAREMGEA